MRSKTIVISALLIALIMTAGCVFGEKYPLPDDPVKAAEEYYTFPDGRGAAMRTINGREYVLYGNLDGTVRAKDTGEVIGYVVREEYPDDLNLRLVKLAATDDIIMEKYVNGMMDQPVFYRALDTIGKDIPVPSFIAPYEEDASFWAGE